MSSLGPPVDGRTEAPPQLRPLGVGDVVDRVFALYRARPLLFIAIAAAPYLVLVLVVTGLTLAYSSAFIALVQWAQRLAAAGPNGPSPADLRLPSGLENLAWYVALTVLFSIVILSAQSAALVYAMSERYLGRQITLGQAFGRGLRAAPSVIGAGLLVFLLLVAFWAVLVVVAVVSQQALVVLAVVLIALAGSVYIAASVLVTPVVATIEGLGPAAALRRSWSLSGGNRWRIIGLQLLLLVLNAVISVVISAIFVTAFFSDITTRTIVQQIANVIATVAWAPVEWGTFAILYYDLRVRHEAFDLQFAAEALPRQP